MEPRPEKSIVGTSYLVERLGVSQKSANNLFTRKLIPNAFRVGKLWRCTIGDVNAYIENQRQKQESSG